jgi:hypothetical protein
MSDTSPFGFGQFVPGFDFLQSLTKGPLGTIPKLPQLSNWVAPTLSVEELTKRIDELKAVQFWLEQNSRALSATVQALEVQKMTLATLQGMNVSMGDLAKAFQPPSADGMAAAVAAAAAAVKVHSAPPPAAAQAPAAASPAPHAAADAHSAKHQADDQAGKGAEASASAAAGVVDPMQWWGALTTQFQHIAASALKDANAHSSALDSSAATATLAKAADMAQQAFKTASGLASQFTAAQRKAAAAAATTPATAPSAAKTKSTASKKASQAAGQTAAQKTAPAKKAAAKTTTSTTTRARSPARHGKPAA